MKFFRVTTRQYSIRTGESVALVTENHFPTLEAAESYVKRETAHYAKALYSTYVTFEVHPVAGDIKVN